MFWFALVVCLAVPPVAYLMRRADAERQLQPLLAAGWEPEEDVLERARTSLARQQVFVTTGAAVGGVLTLPALATLLPEPAYGVLGFGLVSGSTLGGVAGHLSGGRIPTGPRVAEAVPRCAADYLGRAHLVALGAWGLVTAVAAPWALLQLRSVEGPAGWLVPGALVVAAGWLVAALLMGVAVLRRRTTARAEGDLVWQEWLRARVLSDLAGSLWLSVCCVGTALWVALLEGSGAAIAMELAGWITALAVLGLFAFWWARTGIPAAVQEAVAC